MTELARQPTPLELEATARALLETSPELSPLELSGLLAIVWLETSGGARAFNWNVGNVALASENGPFWRPPWYGDANDPRSDPNFAPQAFRAYDSLGQGAADFVGQVRALAPQFLRLSRQREWAAAFGAYVRGYVRATPGDSSGFVRLARMFAARYAPPSSRRTLGAALAVATPLAAAGAAVAHRRQHAAAWGLTGAAAVAAVGAIALLWPNDDAQPKGARRRRIAPGRVRGLSVLDSLEPDSRRRMRELVDYGASLGHAVTVADGFRTCERQNEIFAQGRTTPGVIATHARGCVSWHTHGRAVDLSLDGGKAPTSAYAELGKWWEAHGGNWGGRFGDPGHFEWRGGLAIEQLCPEMGDSPCPTPTWRAA